MESDDDAKFDIFLAEIEWSVMQARRAQAMRLPTMRDKFLDHALDVINKRLDLNQTNLE
jgi:hypothetical protein